MDPAATIRRGRKLRSVGLSVIALLAFGFVGHALASSRSDAATKQAKQAYAARSSMSALSTASRVAVLPPGLAQLPAGYAPAAGTVRALLSDVGLQHVSLYAWPQPGNANRVCMQTSFGSGGCFATFSSGSHFDVTVSDPDQVGAGLPVIVWGVVPDEVSGVDVMIAGEPHAALVSDNAVYYAVESGSATPDTIDAFVVHFRDGSNEVIDY